MNQSARHPAPAQVLGAAIRPEPIRTKAVADLARKRLEAAWLDSTAQIDMLLSP